jgi:hypothetical protein
MKRMRAYFASLAVLMALSIGVFAGEIRKGAAMEVRANSIWFQDVPRLTHWQKLKKSHSPELAPYEENVLGSAKLGNSRRNSP